MEEAEQPFFPDAEPTKLAEGRLPEIPTPTVDWEPAPTSYPPAPPLAPKKSAAAAAAAAAAAPAVRKSRSGRLQKPSAVVLQAAAAAEGERQSYRSSYLPARSPPPAERPPPEPLDPEADAATLRRLLAATKARLSSRSSSHAAAASRVREASAAVDAASAALRVADAELKSARQVVEAVEAAQASDAVSQRRIAAALAAAERRDGLAAETPLLAAARVFQAAGAAAAAPRGAASADSDGDEYMGSDEEAAEAMEAMEAMTALRPGGAPAGRRGPQRYPRSPYGSQLTDTSMRAVLHLSLGQAAAACHMGTTQFKLQCRKLGVLRWPHRKLASVRGLLEWIEYSLRARAATPDVLAKLAVWKSALEAVQMRALQGPLSELPEWVEKFRGWTIKHRSMEKRKVAKAAQPLTFIPPPPGPEEMEAVQAGAAAAAAAAGLDEEEEGEGEEAEAAEEEEEAEAAEAAA